MNYIDEIFARADIQQIRKFLLHGVEETCVDPRSYRERIASADDAVTARLKKDYPNEKDFEEIMGPIYRYVGTIEEVYMEIGLQVGAILDAQTALTLRAAIEWE